MPQRPDPAPLETNDVAIIMGGTALWAVALIVLLVLKAAGTEIHTWWLVMCGYGFVMGLLGVRSCQRRRDRLAKR